MNFLVRVAQRVIDFLVLWPYVVEQVGLNLALCGAPQDRILFGLGITVMCLW